MTIEGEKIIAQTLGKKGLSNCYLSYDSILNKMDIGEMEWIVLDHMVVLIEDKHLFHNMYYFIENRENTEIDHALEEYLMKYNILAANVVMNINEISPEVLMDKLGFGLYKKYVRKSMLGNLQKSYPEKLNPEFAQINELDEIYDLLYGIFDIVTDTLPTKEELWKFISNKQVLKISLNNEIAGVLLFEDKGCKSYTRAFCVKEKYRKCSIGYSLFAKYINMHLNSTKMFYLWADSENDYVHKFYEKFGYKNDGLIDYIYLYGEKHAEKEYD